MINDEVIKEIYKKFKRPPSKLDELNLPYFQGLLSDHNPIEYNDGMVEIKNLDQFSPFKRFLLRSVCTILEFERMVAFVFNNRILFLDKEKPDMHIHLKPERRRGLLGLFSR